MSASRQRVRHLRTRTTTRTRRPGPTVITGSPVSSAARRLRSRSSVLSEVPRGECRRSGPRQASRPASAPVPWSQLRPLTSSRDGPAGITLSQISDRTSRSLASIRVGHAPCSRKGDDRPISRIRARRWNPGRHDERTVTEGTPVGLAEICAVVVPRLSTCVGGTRLASISTRTALATLDGRWCPPPWRVVEPARQRQRPSLPAAKGAADQLASWAPASAVSVVRLGS
jgi:hypothetical protein